MLLLASELPGSKKTTQLSRSHVCQNMTNMKGNTKRRLFITDKIIMNIWEIPPLNPGQHIIIILLLLFFLSGLINFFIFPSVKINCHLFMNMNLFQFQPFYSLFFGLFFNHKPWRLLPLGILWKQIDHIIFWCKVRKDQLKKRSRWSHDATWLFLHSPWTSANMDDRKTLAKVTTDPVSACPTWSPTPSFPDKGWSVARRPNLWHVYTPGDCGRLRLFFGEKKNTARERKARQELTLHQLNDAEPR